MHWKAYPWASCDLIMAHWLRVNQKPTDRPRNNAAPCQAARTAIAFSLSHPFPSQSSAEQDARTASVTCPAWSFPTNPVLNCSYFLVWMTHSLCCETLGGDCCSLFGSECTASDRLTLIFMCKLPWGSPGSSTWDHGSSGIPRAGNLQQSCFSSAP